MKSENIFISLMVVFVIFLIFFNNLNENVITGKVSNLDLNTQLLGAAALGNNNACNSLTNTYRG